MTLTVILCLSTVLAICACLITRSRMLKQSDQRTFRSMQRLSKDASDLIVESQDLATTESYVTTGHLILALIQRGYFNEEFYQLRFDEDMAAKYLKKHAYQSVSTNSPRPGGWHFNSRMKNVLRLADKEATLLSDEKIAPQHLLLGVLLDGDGPGFQALAQQGVTYDAITKIILD